MWLILAFFSAALLGFYDVFKKKALTGNALIPVLTLNTLFCSLIFLPMILGSALGIIGNDSPAYIPSGNWEMHKFILLKSVIVLSSWAFGYAGIKHLPITIVGPINATRPVMTLMGALIIFGERLNAWQWVGVILAVFSFFMLSRSSKREGVNFAHNKWIICVVCSALLGAASGLYDKYLMSPVEEDGAGLNNLAVQGWYNLDEYSEEAMAGKLIQSTNKIGFRLAAPDLIMAAVNLYKYSLDEQERKLTHLMTVLERYARRIEYLMTGISRLIQQLVDAGIAPCWQPDHWRPESEVKE